LSMSLVCINTYGYGIADRTYDKSEVARSSTYVGQQEWVRDRDRDREQRAVAAELHRSCLRACLDKKEPKFFA
jgi:hypothetical protein